MTDVPDPSASPDTDIVPADCDDLEQTLAFALTHDGRKAFRGSNRVMAALTARHLVTHLRRCGFVLVRRHPDKLAPDAHYRPQRDHEG